jgi:hypothetical protein
VLKRTKFVPNDRGELFAPSDLYDPSVTTLHDLLDGSCFPTGRLSSLSALASLRQLGLRHAMTPQGLLTSVQSVVRDMQQVRAVVMTHVGCTRNPQCNLHVTSSTEPTTNSQAWNAWGVFVR